MIAYYMGRKSAANEVINDCNKIFIDQEKRASECRYHEMAKSIIGTKRIYDADYAGIMSSMFGNDETNI